MATAADAAQYVNDQFFALTKVKLQKLLYLAQGFYLARDDRALFSEKFVAWEKGPAIRSLHESMKSQEKIVPAEIADANPDCLTNGERLLLDSVVKAYGDLTADELVALAHADSCWKDVRRDAEMSNDDIKACFMDKPWPLA